MATVPPDRGAMPGAFADARGCKEWLATLPLTNIPQAQAMLLEGLQALNAGSFDPLERLKCLELARERASFLQGEQRSRYFGKTLPLSPTDAGAWNTGRLLLAEIETGYRRCQEAGGEAMHAHRALILQRLMRYVGAQMAFHASIYRRFEPELWLRLHGLYAAAEKEGLLEEHVKDSLESDDRGSSPMEAYVHVVLLQASYLSELTAPQMDFVEGLLRAWARKVGVKPLDAAAPSAATHPLAVDLEKSIGARPLGAADALPSHRVLLVEELSKSLRKRIHGLAKGDSVADLRLPVQASGIDVHSQLQRLHKLWCEGAPPRPPARVPAEKTAGVVWSLPDIHFFLSGGKAFEQPGQSRELTRQEKQDIEIFGRVREHTQTHSRMASVPNVTAEPWGVIDEMLGAWRLMRPSTASRGVAIGRVLAMRLGDTADFHVGYVSALVQELDGSIVITLRLFPGKPEPLAARAGEPRNRGVASQWSPAIALPALEKLRVPATLVVTSGLGPRGRQVEIWSGGAKALTVKEVLERGTDFDRILAA